MSNRFHWYRRRYRRVYRLLCGNDWDDSSRTRWENLFRLILPYVRRGYIKPPREF